MPNILNNSQLKEIMEEEARKALEATADDIIKIFKRDYIMKFVYESHMPNVKYHANSRTPTYEFRDAWDWSALKKVANTISKTLWFDSDKLDFNQDTFKHGSKYSSPEDVRASLPDILNKKGRSSSLWLSSTAIRPVAYWNQFIEDMFDRGELEKILLKHFSARGFSRY